MIGGALLSGAFGALVSFMGLLAQASGSADNLAPWASGGGAAASVGAIIYIARLMAIGRLVARDTAVAEATLTQLTKEVTEIAKAALEQQASYHQLLVDRLTAEGRKPGDRR